MSKETFLAFLRELQAAMAGNPVSLCDAIAKMILEIEAEKPAPAAFTV